MTGIRTNLMNHVRSHPMMTAGLAASAGVLAGGVLMVQVLGTPSPDAKIKPGVVAAPPPVVVAAPAPAPVTPAPTPAAAPTPAPQQQAEVKEPPAAAPDSECEKQTWPYLSQACIDAAKAKRVTRVIAPEKNVTTAVATPANAAPAPAAPQSANPAPAPVAAVTTAPAAPAGWAAVPPTVPPVGASTTTTGAAPTADRDAERKSRSERLFGSNDDTGARDRDARKREREAERRSKKEQRELAKRDAQELQRKVQQSARQELAVSDVDDDEPVVRVAPRSERRSARGYAEERGIRIERRVVEERRPSLGPFEALFGGFD